MSSSYIVLQSCKTMLYPMDHLLSRIIVCGDYGNNINSCEAQVNMPTRHVNMVNRRTQTHTY